MTNQQSPGGVLSDDEFRWLSRRLEGGFGIVTTCATHVSPDAQAWPGQMGTFAAEHLPALERLANAGSKTGGLVIPQLFHGGFRSPRKLTGVQPTSASACFLDLPNFETPRALAHDEILRIKSHFVAAAKLAVGAGLPGVEIHGANGYLFTQFLSPHTNKRTDQWGGALASRARFLIETVREVRAAIGADKIVGVRLSPEDTQQIREIRIDEMLQVGRWLQDCAIDYLSVSLGQFRQKPLHRPDAKDSIISLFRQALGPRLPLIVSGQIWSQRDAEDAFADGASLVALGQSGIANPDWPERVGVEGREPRRFPMTPDELRGVAVSPRFVDYLRAWKTIVADD